MIKIGKSINPLHRERTLQSEKPTISLFAVCEEDIETCKRNCEYNFSDKNEEIEDDEQAEDNTSDLDFSEKDGCAALGGLTAIIRDIYKMIRVFLSIFLVIITMLDYAKVIMDNDDFKSFKKAC